MAVYYELRNADGKVWIMPARHLRTAMELYQPGGPKGKLLKQFFPLLHRIGIVRRVAGATVTAERLPGPLAELLRRVLGVDEPEYSIFKGTPSVHQKTTIQLFDRDRILAYCKTTQSEEIAGLFASESKVLSSLEAQGVKGIPRCLYCGDTTDGLHTFVQSTEKTPHSRVLHGWTPLHDEFIATLHSRTRRRLPYEDTDYCHTMHELAGHLHWLPATIDRSLVERMLAAIEARWSGKEVEFSAYHADFTPWNMVEEQGRLFVFDWEYSRLTYPPGLYRYHFATQTAIFERHLTAAQIIEEIDRIGATDYMLYLADVVARFTMRERGRVSESMAASFALWGELLAHYLR